MGHICRLFESGCLGTQLNHATKGKAMGEGPVAFSVWKQICPPRRIELTTGKGEGPMEAQELAIGCTFSPQGESVQDLVDASFQAFLKQKLEPCGSERESQHDWECDIWDGMCTKRKESGGRVSHTVSEK